MVSRLIRAVFRRCFRAGRNIGGGEEQLRRVLLLTQNKFRYISWWLRHAFSASPRAASPLLPIFQNKTFTPLTEPARIFHWCWFGLPFERFEDALMLMRELPSIAHYSHTHKLRHFTPRQPTRRPVSALPPRLKTMPIHANLRMSGQKSIPHWWYR